MGDDRAMANLARYRPSGRTTPLFLLLTLVAMAAGAALAWPYQVLMTWIPYVYLNALVWLGLGAAVLFATIFVVNTGKNRNRVIGALAGLAIGASAVGASHYVAYSRLVDNVVDEVAKGEDAAETEAEIRHVLTFSKYVDLRVEVGWSLGRHSSSSGKGDLTGVLVWAIWAIEALGIIGAGVFGGLHSEPFCEACTTAMVDRTLVTERPVDGQSLAALASAQSLDAVLAVPPLPQQPTPTQLSYVAHECARCQGDVYLTVNKHWQEQGKNGLEAKSEVVQREVTVTRAQAGALVAALSRSPARPSDGLAPRPPGDLG
jgi:hypothetical protein